MLTFAAYIKEMGAPFGAPVPNEGQPVRVYPSFFWLKFLSIVFFNTNNLECSILNRIFAAVFFNIRDEIQKF